MWCSVIRPSFKLALWCEQLIASGEGASEADQQWRFITAQGRAELPCSRDRGSQWLSTAERLGVRRQR